MKIFLPIYYEKIGERQTQHQMPEEINVNEEESPIWGRLTHLSKRNEVWVEKNVGKCQKMQRV